MIGEEDMKSYKEYMDRISSNLSCLKGRRRGLQRKKGGGVRLGVWFELSRVYVWKIYEKISGEHSMSLSEIRLDELVGSLI